jgi:ubiquinone/menaquinone biosynthesis C-methylase UbiE
MHSIQRARTSMFGLAHHPQHYESFAARLGARLYRRVANDVALAVAAGVLPADARILDAGTGPGLLPRRIAENCPQLRIDAIDVSAEMIAAARSATDRPARIDFTEADVAALPFADGSFDLVVSSISQHHWADPGAGMREIARVLRPGAPAWIYDFRWSLNRARAGAETVRPAVGLTRQSPLPGSSWLNPIGRLILLP